MTKTPQGDGDTTVTPSPPVDESSSLVGGDKGDFSEENPPDNWEERLSADDDTEETPSDDDEDETMQDTACHKTQEDKENEETDNEEDEETETIVMEAEEKQLQYQVRVVFPHTKEKAMRQIKDLVLEMLANDDLLGIQAQDTRLKDVIDPIMYDDDIPSNIEEFNKFFPSIKEKRNRDGTTIIMRLITKYSLTEWKAAMKEHLQKNKIKIFRHLLEAKDGRLVGFVAMKHPKLTHMVRYHDYVTTCLPRDTPQFSFEIQHVSISNGLRAPVKTDVISVRTSITDIDEVDKRFKKVLPTATNGTEFYVSFVSNIEDKTMREIYKQQNKWLHEVDVVNVGGYINIDKPHQVGLAKPVSLREFMKSQPTLPDGKQVPIDIENGGPDGKAKVIVLPKHRKLATKVYEEYEKMARNKHSSNDMEMEDDNTNARDSPARDAYVRQLESLFTQAATEDKESDEEDETEESLAPPSYNKQNQKKTKQRSWAEVARKKPDRPETMKASEQETSRPKRRKKKRSDDIDDSDSDNSSVSSMSTLSDWTVESDDSDDTPLPDIPSGVQGDEMIRHLWATIQSKDEKLKKSKKKEKKLKVSADMDKKRLEYVCNAVEEWTLASRRSDVSPDTISLAESVNRARGWVVGDDAPPPVRPKTITINNTHEEQQYDKQSPPAETKPTQTKESQESGGWQSPERKHTATTSVTPSSPTNSDTMSTNPYGPLAEGTDDVARLTTLGRLRSPKKESPSGKPRKKSRISEEVEGAISNLSNQQDMVNHIVHGDGKVDGAFTGGMLAAASNVIRSLASTMATDEIEMNPHGAPYDDVSDSSL